MNLEPLRRALLEHAEAEAARIRAAAEARAAETVARAEREGAASVEQAALAGAATGRLGGDRDLAAALRRARTEVLHARRDLHDELRARVRAAALALRAEPGYPALLEELAAAARHQLGEDAVVDVDPSDAGGVRATAAGRSVDYSLVAMADRCLERLAARLEELWT
jgi:vacuolar-type H+-ATPase subunit E/Vma4